MQLQFGHSAIQVFASKEPTSHVMHSPLSGNSPLGPDPCQVVKSVCLLAVCLKCEVCVSRNYCTDPQHPAGAAGEWRASQPAFTELW